jgi:hypothetical protein
VQELKKEVAALTARLDEHASQIQKVSAQLAAASPSRGGLEASKAAPQVVNKLLFGVTDTTNNQNKKEE